MKNDDAFGNDGTLEAEIVEQINSGAFATPNDYAVKLCHARMIAEPGKEWFSLVIPADEPESPK